MQLSSKIATIAVVVAGLALAGTGVASAVEAANVTAAYADGYMGTDGQFHAWESRADAQDFRAKHADQYHAWRHDDPRHQSH
jgi:hypothetical protein